MTHGPAVQSSRCKVCLRVGGWPRVSPHARTQIVAPQHANTQHGPRGSCSVEALLTRGQRLWLVWCRVSRRRNERALKVLAQAARCEMAALPLDNMPQA